MKNLIDLGAIFIVFFGAPLLCVGLTNEDADKQTLILLFIVVAIASIYLYNAINKREKRSTQTSSKTKFIPKKSVGENEIITKVVGVTFNNRQSTIKSLSIGETLKLVPEPNNLHDKNAIRVERLNGKQVGYINRELARERSSFLSNNYATVVEKIGSIRKGQSLGVVIKVCKPEANQKSNSFVPTIDKGKSKFDSKTILSPQKVSGKLARKFLGHQSVVWGCDFSPDEKYIASCSRDTFIKLWQLDNADCLKTLIGHKKGVCTVTFSLDGTSLLSGSQDGTIKVWDIESGQCLKTINTPHETVTNALYLDDGKKIISCGWDASIRVWHTESGKEVFALEKPSSVTSPLGATYKRDALKCLAITLDEAKVIAGGMGGSLDIWDLEKRCLVMFLHEHRGFSNEIEITPDGRKIISADSSGFLYEWNLNDGKLIHLFQNRYDYCVDALAISPNGNIIASGGEEMSEMLPGTIRIWDLNTRSLLKSLEEHKNLLHLKFSPSGNCLLSAGDSVCLWNI